MAGIAHFAGSTAVARPSLQDRLSPLLRFVDAPEGAASWRIELIDEAFEIVRTKNRASAFPDEERETLISAGSALFMLRLAMRCQGMRPRIEYRMEATRQGTLARVFSSGPASPSGTELSLLMNGAHPGAALDMSSLKEAASEEGTRLHTLPSSSLRAMVECEDCEDHFENLGDQLAILCTSYDDPISWMIAGQAARRLQLVAGDAGSTLRLVNSPLAVPGLRARFTRETRFCDFPQAILTGLPAA